MKFSGYMATVTYFMALLGLYSLTLVEPIERGFIFFTAAAVFTSLFLNLKKTRIMPSGFYNLLALAVFLLFTVYYFSSIRDMGDIIVTASRFLAVLLAIKLFDLNANRDYIIVYGAVFFLILAAAASTVSLVFFPLLVLFIIGAIFAMITVNLKKEFEKRGLSKAGPPAGLFDIPFFLSLTTVTVVSIAVTFILFFLIPRMETGFFERKTLNAVKVTGFSDTVELGSMGAVKKDHTVVMRVEFQGGKKPARPVYLRGAVLEDYDGFTWRRGARPKRLVRGKDGFFKFKRSSGPLVEQRILLEPLSTEVIFAAKSPVMLSAGFPNLWRDSAGALTLPSPPYSRTSYTVWSSTEAPQRGASAPDDSTGLLDISAVAEGRGGVRLQELAAMITTGLKTAPQKASAIKRYLMDNYRYTLDPSRGAGLNPIDDFLFFTKEGYCEQFATAFALLLRASGIPARLVTGFLQGEWNGLGGYYIIRQSDAHSWTEVYLDGYGWKRFDPTPPQGLTPYSGASRLSLFLDYMRVKWNRHIIGYSFKDQRSLAGGFQVRANRLLGDLKERLRSGGGRGSLLIVLVLLIIIAAGFFTVMRGKGSSGGRSPKTPAFYLQMLKVLARKGFRRGESESPMEFSSRIDNPGVSEVTRLFILERYGGRRPGFQDIERVKEILGELKRSLRRAEGRR